MQHNVIGVIGLGVMGRALALNLADRGLAVVGWDPAEASMARATAAGSPIQARESVPALVASVPRPRVVLLSVPAGGTVDQQLTALVDLLEEGDIVLDAGNSHWAETERRWEWLASKGIQMLGVGVSGGEQGARHGPSIMVGGSPEAWDQVGPVLEAAAARVEGEACAAYFGEGGAGHFVKAVHNGIEYADMQLLGEAQLLLSSLLGLGSAAQAEVFARWAEGDLGSFLVEITAQILASVDPLTGRDVLEVVDDVAGQKGTGIWASQAALELGVAAPTIMEAVAARALSTRSAERTARSPRWPAPLSLGPALPLAELERALVAARLSVYAQGFALLEAGAQARPWPIELATVARIWRGGCIIRAKLLELVQVACTAFPAADALLDDPSMAARLWASTASLRSTVARAAVAGVSIPAMGSALSWVEASHASPLWTRLIQAQRDVFGAHGFGRIDRPGRFHIDGSEA